MAQTVGNASWSPDALEHPNRYWAGRHHLDVMVGIVQALAKSSGHSSFKASAIDQPVLSCLNRDETANLSKGTRWAYLKVLRDVGLVVISSHNSYYLTNSAHELARREAGYREVVVRALIRPYEADNPVHAVLGFFLDGWPSSPEDFVTNGRVTSFERHSENSLWVRYMSQTRVSGFGKNQFNQVWNGINLFLHEVKLVWRIDSLEGGMSVRNLAPVWDWSEPHISKDPILGRLKQFVNQSYPAGKMVSLPDLARDFWAVARVSASVTVACLDSWSREPRKELRLVRAPASVADSDKTQYIINEQGIFGAFVRRRV